jgi:APA family basic amino acid/polyamine antiporter
VAPRLTAPQRRLRARSLILVAYGEIGSSLIFALGIIALYAAGTTPWILLAVGLLVLVVTLSYAEGSTAMPEPGGAATFVRRAFSDPAGFVTGWLLFLDYLVVIALTALFVPHYVGEAFGWDAVADRPWDAVIGILVILALAAVRRARRIRLYAVAVVVAGIAIVAQLLLAIAGFAVIWSSDALTVNIDVGRAPSWGSIALALSLALLAYTGLETITNFAAEVREPGRTLPRTLFLGIATVVVINVAVSMVGVSAYPTRVDPAGTDGVSTALATDWLQAPLLGVARAVGDHLGGSDVLAGIIGVADSLVLVTVMATALAGAERLAYSMARYDMLPHVFARPERGASPTGAATLAAAVIAPVLIAIADVIGDGPRFLAGVYSFGVLVAMTAAQLAVVRLRLREPDLERPFRVPLGVPWRGRVVPLPPLIGAALTAALWVASLFTHGGAIIAGPVWLAIGIGVYAWSRRAGGKSLLGRATPAVADLVPAAEGDADTILVPLKLGAIGEEVLATALRLAEERSAAVHVLTVVRVPLSRPLEGEVGDEQERGREAIEEAEEIAAEHGVTVTGQVVRARSLSEAIIDEARAIGADLIVMGSASRWRSQSRFFSPAVDEVLRGAPCDVMVVTYPPGVLEVEEEA